MIVVATADFEVYHGVVSELRDHGVSFTTIEPDEGLPDRTEVVLTAPDDDLDAEVAANDGEDDADIEVVVVDSDDPGGAIEAALATVRGADGRTIVGVDPGEHPGIAVCTGEVVVAAFQVPLAEAAAVIEREASEANDPVVRIGDGARLRGASIVDDLKNSGDLTVELIDETGTTPSLGTGTRGMGDVLAAANIARLPGEQVETREVEPTDGEIDRIKRRSPRASGGDRTIDEALARRVATGELTIEEALAEHRSR